MGKYIKAFALAACLIFVIAGACGGVCRAEEKISDEYLSERPSEGLCCAGCGYITFGYKEDLDKNPGKIRKCPTCGKESTLEELHRNYQERKEK